jgi:hypothetical protein
MPNPQRVESVSDQGSVLNGLEFSQYLPGDRGRPVIEKRIVDAYQEKFSARLVHFMPSLVSAKLPGQEAHLAFGLRAANEHSLYLENYLSAPVQRELARVNNTPVSRASIVEIGNLAFSDTSNIVDDLISVAYYCYSLGYRYVVCTATRMLRLVFLKAGIKPLYMGEANLEDVPYDGTHWGGYYEASPQIIGGNVLMGIQHLLSARFDCEEG